MSLQVENLSAEGGLNEGEVLHRGRQGLQPLSHLRQEVQPLRPLHVVQAHCRKSKRSGRLCVSGRLPFDSGGKFLVGGEHLHLHAVQQIGADLESIIIRNEGLISVKLHGQQQKQLK